MKQLKPVNYSIASQLLLNIHHHTVLKTMIIGTTPGIMYVDDIDSPEVVFAQFKHRAFVSGNPRAESTAAIPDFIVKTGLDYCQKKDIDLFSLTASSPELMDICIKALESYDPIISDYQCYQYSIDDLIDNINLPEGFEIFHVNEELLQNDFIGKEDLLEEMCSERDSVESFLEHSFGIVAFHQGELAGWCLSEYNFEKNCEVGIATLSPFQNKGLAKAMTNNFLNLAYHHGINKVLWHCFKSNIASQRTALSAGFILAEDEQILMLFPDCAEHFAEHGNQNYESKNFTEALSWYRRALEEDKPQPWMAWNAACAAANTEQFDLAFSYLDQAIDLGFRNLDHLLQSETIQVLKKDSRWQSLIARIEQNRFI